MAAAQVVNRAQQATGCHVAHLSSARENLSLGGELLVPRTLAQNPCLAMLQAAYTPPIMLNCSAPAALLGALPSTLVSSSDLDSICP